MECRGYAKDCVERPLLGGFFMQVYREKRKALSLIEGSQKEQYNKMRDYCNILIQKNLGTTTILEVERPMFGGPTIFQRFFFVFCSNEKWVTIL